LPAAEYEQLRTEKENQGELSSAKNWP